jgi:hypothetical protein
MRKKEEKQINIKNTIKNIKNNIMKKIKINLKNKIKYILQKRR